MSVLVLPKDVEDLLECISTPSEKFVDLKMSRLTAPGENYGSIMLRILVTVQDTTTGIERQVDTVAKTMPDSAITREVFNSLVTFRCEYQYYASIVPILDTLLKSKGFQYGADFAAPFYGGRLNCLENGDQADENAVILLANLKSAGYKTGTKQEGLDLESAKVALDSLAKFHASGLALRHQNPEVFEQKLRPYFYSFVPSSDLNQLVFKTLVHTLQVSGFSKDEVDRVKDVYRSDSLKKNISDVWGTMIHYDTWTNNILLKYEDSKPIHAILVDFQTFEYGTPLNDVMFFLFTSVQQHVFEKNFDNLVEFYHDKLMGYLKQLTVDIRTFTKASFDAEVKSAVKNYEYFHAMWMLEVLMDAKFESLDEMKSLNSCPLVEWTDEHVQKIKCITRLCFDKKWL